MLRGHLGVFAVLLTLYAKPLAAQPSNWVLKTPSTVPAARFQHAMVYDAARGQMVMFGGLDSSTNRLNDTWVWDGTNWTQKSPANRPTGRFRFAMAYDTARAQTVLFAGIFDGYYNDTWVWDGTNWTQRIPTNSPPWRLMHAMASDGARGQVVLFGGFGPANSNLDDTWVWDGANWTQKSPAIRPPGRSWHAMAYDETRRQVVLFGGSQSGKWASGDTWVWDGTGWVQKHPVTSPPPRTGHAMAYDAVRGVVVLFGGSDVNNYPLNDTWVWDGSNWVRVNPLQTPPTRDSAVMAYDTARGQVLLYGGWNWPNSLNDTWVLSGVYPRADVDTDGDGLPDDWESNGVTVTVNGASTFVNLPAMGADPGRKDIFVQTDFMVDPGYCLPFLGCAFGHSHKPKPEAVAAVIQSFANSPVSNPDGSTGITLHVDCGADCFMNPRTGQTWGSLSHARSLAHLGTLGSSDSSCAYNWTKFDEVKAANFSPSLAPIFHYAVFAHNASTSPSNIGPFAICASNSGISRGVTNGASDFIVSLGEWAGEIGTVQQQAGTFMHELGHNLSLRHGGADDVNYKPNFLSVMNYLFQTSGIATSGALGTFDYSRFLLPSLDENHLNEAIGLNGGTAIANYGTAYYCPGGGSSKLVTNANGAINWNCNGVTGELDVAAPINLQGVSAALGVLTSHNDWPSLVFTGGSVGDLGLAKILPIQTSAQDEITPLIDSQITKQFGVAVISPGITPLPAGGSVDLVFTIVNGGNQADTYELVATATVPWANMAVVPPTLALNAGASLQFPIHVTVPSGTLVGTRGHFTIKAMSRGASAVQDTGDAVVTALTPPTIQCTGCYLLINNVRATLAFNIASVGSSSTFAYNYRTATQTVQFASTTTSQISGNGTTVTFSGQGKLNGVAGYAFVVTAKDGGGVGSGLDTISISLTGPGNYSYTANGTVAGGDILLKQ